MLEAILKSPMEFFDTTPQGRILNRFGKDVDVLDATMPMIIRGWLMCFMAVVSTFLIIIYTTPTFIIPLSVIMVCYFFVQRIYVATSRQLKRMESVSRSPIYSHFGEHSRWLQLASRVLITTPALTAVSHAPYTDVAAAASSVLCGCCAAVADTEVSR